MHTAHRDKLGVSDELQLTWTRKCEDHERSIWGGNGLKIAEFFDRLFRIVICTDSWRAQSQQINRKYKNFDVLRSFVLHLLRHSESANSNEICEWELECESKLHVANGNVLMWFHFSLSKQTDSRYAPELLALNMTDTKLNFILLNVTACKLCAREWKTCINLMNCDE